jgi:hypothetical protein
LEVSEVKEWNRQTKFEDEDPSAGWVQGLCAMLAKKRAGKQQKANVSVVPTVGTSSSSSDSHNKETEKTTKP